MAGYGYWDIGRLYRNLDNQVPYFAAHPPVYYSYPVPRPYGYSPFAYPPNVQTPEIVAPAVKPQEILNPYVPKATKKDDGADRTTQVHQQPKPLLVVNPYVSRPLASDSIAMQAR